MDDQAINLVYSPNDFKYRLYFGGKILSVDTSLKDIVKKMEGAVTLHGIGFEKIKEVFALAEASAPSDGAGKRRG